MFRRLADRLKTLELAAASRAAEIGSGSSVPQSVVPKQPAEPSPEQRRAHEATHCPYESWCEHCVAFRGRDDAHPETKGSEDRMPCISFDYGFSARAEGEPKMVALFVHDAQTGWRECFPVPAKGGVCNGMNVLQYLASELRRLVAFLGYSQIILKSDPEPTCLALQNEVKRLRLGMGLRTVCQQVPEGSHQSNGGAEMCVNTVRQVAGSILSFYESKTGQKIASDRPLHSWALRHSAFLLNRFQVRPGGLTAFESAVGRPYKGAVIPYGETVVLLVSQGAKGKPRFVQGQVLGKVMSSDQWIGCTSSGRLVLARTARRLSPEFSPQDPKLLKDHPWKHPGFIAGSAGRVRVQREPKVELPSGLSPLLAGGDQGQLGAGGGELIEEGRPTAPGDDGDETSINYSPSPVPSAAPGAVAPATVATDAVNSDSDSLSSDTTPAESVAPVVPEVPAAPMDLSDPPSREQPALDEDDRAKRARIAEISFEHGEEDPVEFTQEDCESMFDHDNDVDDSKPDEEPASGVPLELYLECFQEASVEGMYKIGHLFWTLVLQLFCSCQLF